ncbi:MAG: biotin synthase BioB [Candidatus Omnitrophica bacterium]|nr:biotin synthase BioB [Candidatus Omnitrophota bacterium]
MKRAKKEIKTSRKGIGRLLKLPLMQLVARANKTRKEKIGPRLEICGIINAKSGLCPEDCAFCAQSVHHATHAQTYPLKDKKEIVAAAARALDMGAERFGIVISGRGTNQEEMDKIVEAVKEIKKKIPIKICASLGILNEEQLRRLKEAGVSRYHHNIETSPGFFPKICTTHDLTDKIKTIRAAKKAGLKVCSGGIIGLGESWQDRIAMAMLLKELNVDSVPINILVAHKGTPLFGKALLSCNDIIRTIALFRIILKDKEIKLAAGREYVLKDFQGLAFLAGANSLIIGGYLTIKGRDVVDDQNLIQEIRNLWRE